MIRITFTRTFVLYSVALSTLCFATSCTIADEDRCAKGFEYISKNNDQYCEKIKTTDVDSNTGSTDTEVEGDGGPDTTAADMTGLGTNCAGDDTVCDDLGANYCAKNPFAPADSYCTVTGCVGADFCPDGYNCCDCLTSTLLPQLTACLTDGDAVSAVGIAGCSCE